MAHDREAWEARWEKALETHGERLQDRPANVWLTTEADGLEPGRALDAGCGHGAETVWLAARGWRVTGVDFSSTALRRAEEIARSAGVDERVEFVEGDLGTWAPEPGAYDLVVCIYVHVAGDVGEFVRRMAGGVAPSGTLLMVGTVAPGQVQVSAADAREALEREHGDFVVAEERQRAVDDSRIDSVVRWRKR